MTIQKEDEEMEGAGGSRSRMVIERTRRAEGAEEGDVEGERRMRRWLARTSGMRVRNTPGAPLPFRPRLRCPLRAGPACPRGPAINSRLFLSLSSPAARLARDPQLSRRIKRPRGHTPSSREPAGRKKEGHNGPSSRSFLCFRHHG